MTNDDPAQEPMTQPARAAQRYGFAPASVWWIGLFVICGPLNPALLLAGFLTCPDIPFFPDGLPHFSFAALEPRIVFIIGPSILMAFIAIRDMRRHGIATIIASWWRGYWMSVLWSPACFGLFLGAFGVVTGPADSVELFLMVPMVMVMGLVAGWLTLIIPFLSVFIGLPAVVFAILATKACLRGMEHQVRPDVLLA
jgi:hypothetical protein